jgi:hypothetical protein
MSKSPKNIITLIEKGLKLSFRKLVEETIENNESLIFSDGKGNPITVNAKDLKKYLTKK